MSLPKRKQNRLTDYDYSQNGAYFITICSKDKKCIFSKVINDTNTVGATFGRPPKIRLSKIGVIVENEIKKFNTIYENVFIDKYVIMPNHLHLIIQINNDCGRPKVAPTISRVIQQFKGSTTKQVGKAIWQKGFYDHIIRDEYDYQTKWKYIDDNPIKWADDELYQQM